MKGFNHLPGGVKEASRGKEARRQITSVVAQFTKMYAEKVVTEGKMGTCTSDIHTVVLALVLSTPPYHTHTHTLRHTNTHISSD